MSASTTQNPVHGTVGALNLLTTVADLSTTAILSACGHGSGGPDEAQFDGYLTINCALGTFQVHIHACAKRVEQIAPAPSSTH